MNSLRTFHLDGTSNAQGTFIIGGIQATLGGIHFDNRHEGASYLGVRSCFSSRSYLVLAHLSSGSRLNYSPGTGCIWQGIVILIVGTLVISTIDNLRAPSGWQRHPNAPTYGSTYHARRHHSVWLPWLYYCTIIAALYLSVMSIYDNYYLHELKHND